MKKHYSKLWLKASALILLAVFVVIAVASFFGIYFLLDYNVYVDGGRQIKDSVVSGALFRQQMELVNEYYDFYLNGGNSYYDRYFAEENNNFFFTLEDEQGKLLFSNYYTDNYQYSAVEHDKILLNRRTIHEDHLYFQSYEERWSYIAAIQQSCKNVDYDAWDADEDGDGDYECCLDISYTTGDLCNVTLSGYVKAELTASDSFASAVYWVNLLVSMRYYIIVICAVSLILAFILFVYLICAAGHKDGVEGITLNWIDKIPLDIYILLLVLLFTFFAELIGSLTSGNRGDLFILVVFLMIFILPAVSLPITFAARAKAGGWWKNTVIYFCLRLIWRIVLWTKRGLTYGFKSITLCWRTALVWFALSLVEFIFICSLQCDSTLFFFWVIEKAVLTAIILLSVISMSKLQRGGEEMAAGNVNYTVDLSHMLSIFKKHGEDLNSISLGMQRAVDERMRSERLKTELITNVSHDIKTPLTSIVNYVDLLKKEGTDSEKAQEYLGILDRQSARLKKLTEDLVEASKASSGSIAVNMERVSVNLLLSQAVAEYSDKLAAAGLDAVLSTDPQNPEINADGKLLWRVFDNLLSNICKYTLSGTRVYLSTEVMGARVRIVFKNISNYQLNIRSDELMERFVRGDASRSTEGSGLGLSIARSLIDLQKGSFELNIDGDLFKAEISFDMV